MLEDEDGGTALRGGCWRAMAREGEATREGGVNTLHGCSELRSQSSRRASEVKAYDTIATPSRHKGQSRRRQGGPPRERERLQHAAFSTCLNPIHPGRNQPQSPTPGQPPSKVLPFWPPRRSPKAPLHPGQPPGQSSKCCSYHVLIVLNLESPPNTSCTQKLSRGKGLEAYSTWPGPGTVFFCSQLVLTFSTPRAQPAKVLRSPLHAQRYDSSSQASPQLHLHTCVPAFGSDTCRVPPPWTKRGSAV